jgi:murein DD-endopeptidase MepM/ murein hydrolase activator NlpD
MSRHHAIAPSALSIGLAIAGALASANAAALDPSKGVYRIPYANGTELKVGRDHIDHEPPGRIDMNGKDGDVYKVVAAADGFVRYVVDGFDDRLDCKGKPISEQKNNYVWIEHANGEWTKYTHMRKGSSSGKAKLKKNQFVKAGTYLGDEGDVGCASGQHLHFEVGVPKATDGITATGGFLTDNDGSKRNRIPRICGIEDGRFVSGRSYKARNTQGAIDPGGKEYARHGLPARDYQCVFDQAVAAGYALEWIDGFNVGNDVYFNVVFRPAGGAVWAAFHGMSAAQYQQRFDQYTGDGFRPTLVESYLDGNGVRYAVIFRKGAGPASSAYHGVGVNDHQNKLENLATQGFMPRNISVVSVGGQLRYTALYQKTDLGNVQAKSKLSAAEYQQAFDDNAKQNRHLIYLNAYVHGGQPHFAAIWSSKAGANYVARHGLTSAQYQSEWQNSIGAGYLTRGVTGYAVGGTARYGAFWRK